MAEYINREQLIEHLEYLNNELPLITEHNWGRAKGYDEVIDEIKKYPCADVPPVKHGRWIKARGSWCTPGGDPVWECSECGKGMHVYGIEYGAYGSDVADGQWVACPNCGADMRGK